MFEVSSALLLPSALVSLAVGLLLFLLWIWHSSADYMKFDGIPVVEEPTFPFGNMKDLFTGRRNDKEIMRSLYEKLGSKRFGVIFEGVRATILVKDPDLVRKILVDDFEHFSDAALTSYEVDSAPQNAYGLYLMKGCGEQWRTVRSSIGRLLERAHLSELVPKINEYAEEIVGHLERKEEAAGDLSSKLIRSFTLNCTGWFTCSIDLKAAKSCGEFFSMVGYLACTFVPRVANWLGLSYISPGAREHIYGISKRELLQRRERGSQAQEFNDVLGVLSRAQKSHGKEDSVEITDDTIHSVVMQIHIDGFATTSNFVSLAFACLAANETAQEKAFREVSELSAACNNNPTMEDLDKLEYLGLLLEETARVYPSLGLIQRYCTKEWTIPMTNVVIGKGTKVACAASGINMDPALFPEPEKFYPERFKTSAESMLSFGLGPRACPARALVYLEAKLLLFHVLARFELCPGGSLVADKLPKVDLEGALAEGQMITVKPRN